MTRLEDEIRAATRGRAEEITPDRIRPLVLGRPRRRGSRTGVTRRRWVAPVAAAAAVAVIAGVVAGVAASQPGQAPGGTSPSTGRSHATGPARPAGQAVARLDNQVLGLFLAATGPQYAAGMQLNGTILALKAAGTARCLARHGVRVPLPSVASMAARYALDYPDNSQYPDLPRISRTHVFVPAVYLAPLIAPAGQHQAFHHWLSSCQTAAAAPFAPLLAAGQRLGGNAWGTLTSRAATAAPVRATLGALRTCAAHYGWPANPYGPPATAIHSFDDFANWLFGHLDGAGSRGASASTMRRLDRHWSAVFVRCARPTMAAQDRWLAARQDVFVHQHQQQVRAVEALARQVMARAGAGS